MFLAPSKYRLNCSYPRWTRFALCIILVTVITPSTATGQRQEPTGTFVHAGLAAAGGVGVQFGFVNAKDFFTREVTVLADFLTALDPESGNNQVVVTIGGALRLFGFERTIGNVAYRGYDVDLGFRIGPGLSFSTRETLSEKNKRFNLFLEPYVRISVSSRMIEVLFLEAGTTRPLFRLGIWIQI